MSDLIINLGCIEVINSSLVFVFDSIDTSAANLKIIFSAVTDLFLPGQHYINNTAYTGYFMPRNIVATSSSASQVINFPTSAWDLLISSKSIIHSGDEVCKATIDYANPAQSSILAKIDMNIFRNY
jgi:hypothetical protein